MSIQALRNKEQQHAFQHATSAEVRRGLLCEIHCFIHYVKIIQLLGNMLTNQEQIIVQKQDQVARMDVAERRMTELRSLIFNNE